MEVAVLLGYVILTVLSYNCSGRGIGARPTRICLCLGHRFHLTYRLKIDDGL